MTAYFGYENLIPLGLIITATDKPGYEKENAYDWFTYTWWQSPDSDTAKFSVDFAEDQTVDYFGIASHNLNDIGGQVKFEYYDESLPGWIAVLSPTTPQTNAPIFRVFDTVTAKLFRFTFSGYVGASPLVGVLSFGEAMELPEGIQAPFTPPPFAYDDKIFNSSSSTGQFLGRSVERYGQKIKIVQKNLDPEWLRENWRDLIMMLGTQPFFYSWNQELAPKDAAYAWLDDKLPKAQYTNPIHAEFSVDCRALHEVRWV